MNDTYATAFKLLTLGFSVIPSGGGEKHKAPLIPWVEYQKRPATEAELDQWQQEHSPSLWGIVTGKVSGLFVVDCDNAEAKALFDTAVLQPHIKTARGHHYYCQLPKWEVKTCAGILPHIDVRGEGGFVNCAGHNDGASYEVLTMPTPDNLIPFDKLPREVQLAIIPANPKKPQPAAPVGATIAAGARNATLTSLAGTMRRRGADQATIEAALLAENKAKCQPPLSEREVLRIAGSVSRYEPKPGTDQPAHFNLTDYGNAERLVAQYGSNIRYCYERKRWLVWTGKVWEWDTGARITALAKLTVRTIYNEAANEPDEKRRKELAIQAKGSESDHRINAMINLAQSEPGIPVKATELDTNPWLLNCLNGTIDLETGQLLPHRKEDLLTIVVPVEFHPDAQCQRWLSFLDRITGGNSELAGYLQRAVGYTLTGETKEQCLFFVYGLGNNGKSTCTTTIRKCLGEYAGYANTDLFMLKDKNWGGPKESLANLEGKRFIVASELEDGRRLAVGLVKDMTGGERIKADRKFEHEIEFSPTHKIWLVGNHKPIIADTTLSIWRRVKLIPFTVTIPPDEIDRDLPSKLEAELLGILAWAVKGCLDWQRYGLKEPDIVKSATASYRIIERL